MNPKWPLRLMLFLADADKAEGNQIAVEIFNGDEAQDDSYSVPLAATAVGEPSDWLCLTYADEAMANAMVAEMPRVPSIRFFNLLANAESPTAGILVGTNVEAAKARINTWFSLDDALEVLSLKRVQSEALE